jgi:hypothetical protein
MFEICAYLKGAKNGSDVTGRDIVAKRFQAPVQNFMSPVSSIQSFFFICQSRNMLKTGLSFLDSGLETGV